MKKYIHDLWHPNTIVGAENGFIKKTLILIAVTFFVSGFFVPNANAEATLNVYSNSTDATYYDAVVNTADRLVVLQNDDGSWDWVVTGATGPTTKTYLNITGVTAEGLLSAYQITGEQVYLDAAIIAGDHIVNGIDESSPKSINAYNVLFLHKLSTISGVASYAAKAAEYFGMLYSETPTTICASGCLDSTGIVDGQKAVRSWAGDPSGIVLWDLVPYVEYTNLVGDTPHAQELADAIIAEANLETYVSGITNYDLGLASALKAAALVNDAGNVATLGTKITSVDDSYGTTDEGKIQTTSYMVRAFQLTSDTRADASAAYLAGAVLPGGGWVDTDGNEYAEVDSEAITALVGMLPEGIQYYSIQNAVDVANSGDTINVAPGTYLEDLLIEKTIELAGADKATTIIKGIDTEPDANFPLASPNINLKADDVSIHGFTIESPDVADAFYSSGLVANGLNNEIYDNDFVSIASGTGYNIVMQTYRDNVLGFDSDISGMSVHNNTFNGTPGGGYVGIFINHTLAGEGTVSIVDNTFSGNIAQGIFTERSNVNISNNDLTSSFSGSSYGILIEDFDTRAQDNVVATGNTVSDFSTGILIGRTSPSAQVLTNIAITGNTMQNNDKGVMVRSSADGVLINNNSISGNTTYGVENTDTTVLDATNNWWGHSTGPFDDKDISEGGTPNYNNLSGEGDPVTSYVEYNPWYTNSGMDTLSSDKVVISFDFPEGVGVITETNIAVAVPFGTAVTSLVPTIVVSDGASISPETDVSNDFTEPQVYTVTAADGSTQEYIVTVTISPQPAPPAPTGGGGGGGVGNGPPISISSPAIIGDANNDGEVDVLDFSILMENWGRTNPWNIADFNGDGRVDIDDFVILMTNWGK